jgi:hypothetical protein
MKAAHAVLLVCGLAVISGCSDRVTGRRKGNSTGDIEYAGRPCGSPPGGDKGTQLTLSIAAGDALSEAKDSREFGPAFQGEYRKQLRNNLSETEIAALGISLIEYTVCQKCVSLMLSHEQCTEATNKAITAYKEIFAGK